jgi:hypothetical protein
VPDTWSPETSPLRLPVGVEVDGVRLEVRNPAGWPAATGEVGEMWLGTRSTGDLARRRPDGALEVVARPGDQSDEVVAALR